MENNIEQKFNISEQKDKEEQKKFVLEIGCGDMPILYSNFRKLLLENPNMHYIGIDI
ncbi:hypothetical protein HY750_00580 [Candidatus Kuenenbacteria bacterium]|nr:hypothetical protein [Candidatus Kuenenbacteria bacterium]